MLLEFVRSECQTDHPRLIETSTGGGHRVRCREPNTRSELLSHHVVSGSEQGRREGPGVEPEEVCLDPLAVTGGKRLALYPPDPVLSILTVAVAGRRNKHGIPLRKLLIFGRSGLPEVRGWVKEWLKR